MEAYRLNIVYSISISSDADLACQVTYQHELYCTVNSALHPSGVAE